MKEAPGAGIEPATSRVTVERTTSCATPERENRTGAQARGRSALAIGMAGGLGGWTRTSDLSHPRRVRFQLRYTQKGRNRASCARSRWKLGLSPDGHVNEPIRIRWRVKTLRNFVRPLFFLTPVGVVTQGAHCDCSATKSSSTCVPLRLAEQSHARRVSGARVGDLNSGNQFW